VRVENEIRKRYVSFRNALKQLNDTLTKRIVLLLFESDARIQTGSNRKVKPITASEIDQIEDKVKRSQLFAGDDDALASVKSYFGQVREEVRSLQKLAEDPGLRRFLLTSSRFQFQRLRKLTELYKQFDQSATKEYEPLNAFISTLNAFLKESSKEAIFSEVTYSIRFKLLAETDPIGRPIGELSSGERQLVTVLTYLAFLAGENSIFLVDEPELSLHIAWQSRLVESLRKLQPNDCQMILATHSPEIVGASRKSIVRLSPKYTVSAPSPTEKTHA
jgi:predicted ATP-dependent endonuclease of OLD family